MKKLLSLFFLLPVLLCAQELDAKVTVNFDKLPVVNKDVLANFGQAIEDYINSNRYTGEDWRYDKIRCTFNVFFMNATDETHYSAQVSVSSVRPVERTSNPSLMLNVLDNGWEFQYERGQSINFTPDFDPLTDFLDYYAYIIIGLNEDSFVELGGTRYFSRALDIVLLGANSSNSKGWERNSNSYSRRGLVDDLLNERYRGFREDFFQYHYNGLDLLTYKKKQAQDNMVKLIETLNQMKTKLNVYGVLMKVFFDAKNGEITNVLGDMPDKSIFHMLRKLDPPHQTKYDEVLRKE